MLVLPEIGGFQKVLLNVELAILVQEMELFALNWVTSAVAFARVSLEKLIATI
jgi:hypothetical protein